jgi:hypothetical protein
LFLEIEVMAAVGQLFAFLIPLNEHPGAESLVACCKRRLPPKLAPRLVIFLDDFPRALLERGCAVHRPGGTNEAGSTGKPTDLQPSGLRGEQIPV